MIFYPDITTLYYHTRPKGHSPSLSGPAIHQSKCLLVWAGEESDRREFGDGTGYGMVFTRQKATNCRHRAGEEVSRTKVSGLDWWGRALALGGCRQVSTVPESRGSGLRDCGPVRRVPRCSNPGQVPGPEGPGPGTSFICRTFIYIVTGFGPSLIVYCGSNQYMFFGYTCYCAKRGLGNTYAVTLHLLYLS